MPAGAGQGQKSPNSSRLSGARSRQDPGENKKLLGHTQMWHFLDPSRQSPYSLNSNLLSTSRNSLGPKHSPDFHKTSNCAVRLIGSDISPTRGLQSRLRADPAGAASLTGWGTKQTGLLVLALLLAGLLTEKPSFTLLSLHPLSVNG